MIAAFFAAAPVFILALLISTFIGALFTLPVLIMISYAPTLLNTLGAIASFIVASGVLILIARTLQ